MARPGFKPGWGRHPFPGRFDSGYLPPFFPAVCLPVYMIVPTRRKGMHPVMLRVTVAHGSRHALSQSVPTAFHCGAWERSIHTRATYVCLFAAYLIVPTLRVGMHPVTLRVTIAHGSRPALSQSVPGGIPLRRMGAITSVAPRYRSSPASLAPTRKRIDPSNLEISVYAGLTEY